MASSVDAEAVVRRMGAIFQEWGMLPETEGDLSFTKCKILFADEDFLQFLHSLQSNDDVDVARWMCDILRRIVKEHNLQSLLKALKELVDVVSIQENPVGHNELLRSLLLQDPKLPRNFLRTRVLPTLQLLAGTPSETKEQHSPSPFKGATAFLKRLLCRLDRAEEWNASSSCCSSSASASSLSSLPPVSELLADMSAEWSFRNPDFERTVGALKDINKTGPMLRFWKHSHQAHFALLQYQHVMAALLGRLRRVRTETAETETATAAAAAGGAGGAGGAGLVLLLRDIHCLLETLVADKVFQPPVHSEYYSGSSICSLCARHLFEIAPRIGPGPVREEQVISVRLKCDCRMHKSCKLVAPPVIGKHGRRLCPSCEDAPAALWEANEGEGSSNSVNGSTWQQYYYDYLLCALPQCHSFAQRFGQQCLVHTSNPVLLACSVFQSFKHTFRKEELQILDRCCAEVKGQEGTQPIPLPMPIVSEAARLHNILRFGEVFSCITFESLAQKLDLSTESSGVELCAKLVRCGAIEARISYEDHCIFFSASPPSEYQSMAAQVCRQLTQVSGGIHRQHGIAGISE